MFVNSGVLKALAHMRDGLSAVQVPYIHTRIHTYRCSSYISVCMYVKVISEMHEVNIKPDKRHYAMAMFACVVSNQCALAESLMALYLRQGPY